MRNRDKLLLCLDCKGLIHPTVLNAQLHCMTGKDHMRLYCPLCKTGERFETILRGQDK